MGWIRGTTIGKGSFGTVSLAIPTPSTPISSTQFVVKSSELSTSQSLQNEKQILVELENNHPHIILFLGDCSSYENGTHLYNLFLEYAAYGSLADQLKVGKIESSDVKKYTKGMLEGLSYIHDKGYVHCDIKLQNMLLFANGMVKISDFGLSKRVLDKHGSQFRGTPLYMSPEIVSGGEVGSPADIWALGCAVVEMITGMPVWKLSPESDVSALLYRIGVTGESPVLPEGLGCDGMDFVEKCFCKDPNERWTAKMLLTHPFLSGLIDPSCDNNEVASVSPRCPFEFPDLESGLSLSLSVNGSFESFGFSDAFESQDWSSVLRRFEQKLVNHPVESDWDDIEGWINVR